MRIDGLPPSVGLGIPTFDIAHADVGLEIQRRLFGLQAVGRSLDDAALASCRQLVDQDGPVAQAGHEVPDQTWRAHPRFLHISVPVPPKPAAQK